MAPKSDFNLDLTEPFPHLPKPPIVEAVIHWRARAQTQLDPKVHQAMVVEKLPAYTTCESLHQVEVELTATVSGPAAEPVVQQQRGWQGFRLKTNDGAQILQFKRDGLVFSRIKSYSHWESFVSAAKDAWQVFLEIAAPVEIQRLGVRFINHIAGATPDNLHELLREPPTCPSNLPLKEFVYQSTFTVPGHPFSVRVIKVMQPKSELQESSGLFLDVDVFTTRAIPVEPPELDERLTQMRWLKNKVFFALLTNEGVQSFSR